jgi:hypothetical protein
MYRGEAKLRTTLLGEPVKSLRPLSETKWVIPHMLYRRMVLTCLHRAIENGANALAEGFLFAVAASLIIAETWRSSRSSSRRRDDVDDQLETLAASVQQLVQRVEMVSSRLDESWDYEQQKWVMVACNALNIGYWFKRFRNEELARVLTRIVDVGLRGGWAQFEDNPIQLPRINYSPNRKTASSESVEELLPDTPSSSSSSQSSEHPATSEA